MKRSLLLLAMLAATLSLSACGNDKTINGKNYQPYGIINEDDVKDPTIKYEVSVGSVIWSIILSETIVVPVYAIGWDLWQPVRAK